MSEIKTLITNSNSPRPCDKEFINLTLQRLERAAFESDELTSLPKEERKLTLDVISWFRGLVP